MLGKYPTWDEITQYYKADNKMKPMVDLIEYIRSSNYRFRLQGNIFLNDLILSVTQVDNFFSDALHIRFDINNNKFIFTNYHNDDDNTSKPDWEKTYNLSESVKEFDHMMRIAKWY